jgi:hypothetical protein
MNAEALIESYEARKPLYTEGDFVKRFTEIKNARIPGTAGSPAGRTPDDWMIALLASGRVSDAEYFRLAKLLGVDPAGLVHAEPAAQRSLAELLGAAWTGFSRFVSSLRRD